MIIRLRNRWERKMAGIDSFIHLLFFTIFLPDFSTIFNLASKLDTFRPNTSPPTDSPRERFTWITKSKLTLEIAAYYRYNHPP